MLRTIIKKELLQQIQTRKFIISAVVSIILMLLCIHVSSEQYLNKLQDYQYAVTTQQHLHNEIRLITEKNRNDIQMENWDNAVFRKPTPLSIFCRGREYNFGEVGRIDHMSVHSLPSQ